MVCAEAASCPWQARLSCAGHPRASLLAPLCVTARKSGAPAGLGEAISGAVASCSLGPEKRLPSAAAQPARPHSPTPFFGVKAYTLFLMCLSSRLGARGA